MSKQIFQSVSFLASLAEKRVLTCPDEYEKIPQKNIAGYIAIHSNVDMWKLYPQNLWINPQM